MLTNWILSANFSQLYFKIKWIIFCNKEPPFRIGKPMIYMLFPKIFLSGKFCTIIVEISNNSIFQWLHTNAPRQLSPLIERVSSKTPNSGSSRFLLFNGLVTLIDRRICTQNEISKLQSEMLETATGKGQWGKNTPYFLSFLYHVRGEAVEFSTAAGSRNAFLGYSVSSSKIFARKSTAKRKKNQYFIGNTDFRPFKRNGWIVSTSFKNIPGLHVKKY